MGFGRDSALVNAGNPVLSLNPFAGAIDLYLGVFLSPLESTISL